MINYKELSDDEVFQRYKKYGERDAKRELIMRNKHLILKQSRSKFGAVTAIPEGAIEAEGMRLLSAAIDSYDASFGASMQTHFFNYLRKLTRYVNTYGYPVRPSEGVKERFSEIADAENVLTDRFGRAPSGLELSDFLGMPESSVNRIRSQFLKVVSTKDFMQSGETSAVDDYIEFTRMFDLNPQEQLVFDHSTGYKGIEQLRAGQIANKLGVSPAQISHIKKNISTKFENAFKIGDISRM